MIGRMPKMQLIGLHPEGHAQVVEGSLWHYPV
jgi:hypothetical protein